MSYRVIASDGKEYGPFSAADLSRFLGEKRIRFDTMIRSDADDTWLPFSARPEFSHVLSPVTTAPPTDQVLPPPEAPSPELLTQSVLSKNSRVIGTALVITLLLAGGYAFMARHRVSPPPASLPNATASPLPTQPTRLSAGVSPSSDFAEVIAKDVTWNIPPDSSMKKVSETETDLIFERFTDSSTLWSVPIAGVGYMYSKRSSGLEAIVARVEPVHHGEVVRLLKEKLGPPDLQDDAAGYVWFARDKCVIATAVGTSRTSESIGLFSPDRDLVSRLREATLKQARARPLTKAPASDAVEEEGSPDTTTPSDAQALQSSPTGQGKTGPADPYGIAAALEEEIRAFARGQSVTFELGIVLSTKFGIEKLATRQSSRSYDIGGVSLKSAEYGTAEFKGRRLPAGIVRVEVRTIDRVGGEYSSFCILHAIVIDNEFGVRRAPFYKNCEDAATELSAWTNETGFAVSDKAMQVKDGAGGAGRRVQSSRASETRPVVTPKKEQIAVDYSSVTAVMFDEANATGKTIYLVGSFWDLDTWEKRPTFRMGIKTETSKNLWRVFFDTAFNSAVAKLRRDDKLTIVCRIITMAEVLPQCQLISFAATP